MQAPACRLRRHLRVPDFPAPSGSLGITEVTSTSENSDPPPPIGKLLFSSRAGNSFIPPSTLASKRSLLMRIPSLHLAAPLTLGALLAGCQTAPTTTGDEVRPSVSAQVYHNRYV